MFAYSIALLEKELALLQMTDPQRIEVIEDYRSGIENLKNLEQALNFMSN